MKLKLLALTLFVPRVFGWGAAGHEIVATIAQIHLHPSVLPVICEIFNYTSTNPNEPPCHLAPVSTWADRFKYRMRWSAPLHYVGAKDDYPSETCVFPGERGWAGSKNINVLAGIRNVTSLLDAWVEGQRSSDDTAEEALKFLIHFVGDLHMPLHLTGRDRGGNSIKVRFDGRQTNLHSAWDGLLIAKTLRNVPRKYDHQLPIPSLEWNLRGAIYDGFIRQIMWEGILHEWKDQVPEWLACPSEGDTQSSFTEGYWHSFSTFYDHVAHFWNYISSYFKTVSATTDDSTVCPHFWAEPIHAMNCDFIWPKALDEPPYSHLRSFGSDSDSEYLTPRPKSPLLELDTPQYSGYIAENRILEKLMAQGGIRLAGILNWLFADLAEADTDGRISQGRRAEARRRVEELFVTFPAQVQ
ncbi:S1/P1 nuclease [Lentinula aff. detonsa]|uniref:S1/P1 nuclease n=1 Tax=Lentinula aff. detonsa TaxID=2804958 RepID=A0AA38NJQ1_9AGAR|nr:S1/P1 nuclease [Lentinula aff. detonsa]KAJ3793822.1 S1/P1 nuclease [Lentinula aff. detonsa]